MNEPDTTELRRQEALETCDALTAFCVLFFVGFAISAGVVIALMFFKSLER